MAVRKRVLVSGRVQGVFFRDTVRREANKSGVVGSARNLDDGRVEVILEGDEAAVQRVISWCRDGTPESDVESVHVTNEEPQGDRDFRIA